jgi:hypothetical protein
MPAPQGATSIVRPFQASLIAEFLPDLLKTGCVDNVKRSRPPKPVNSHEL